MIIRVLGEGQYDVADTRVRELNALDDRLLAANEADDAARFSMALHELLAAVREFGAPLAADVIVTSDLVLPADDADLAEVRALLSDEGLIPG